jgi:hypothetical protein
MRKSDAAIRPNSGLSFELPNDNAALALAQRLANKTGRGITVTDEDGNVVWRVQSNLKP